MRRSLAFLFLGCVAVHATEFFQLPTANRFLFELGGEEKFFVGTVGKPWVTGTFGCVRTEGWQMHEGLDIRCVQRDKRGEPIDPVLATADGEVAYINARAGLSNYGIYVILRHRVEGIEVYSIYAHLRKARDGLKAGVAVKAGEQIGTMGRTSNTREGISRDRAHVHFELALLINERFAEWFRKHRPGERNDHGDWNGQNLLAMDPRTILLAQREQGPRFSLLNHLRQQSELFRVLVRDTQFPWLKRYAPLVVPNPHLGTNAVAGYELSCNFNGIPISVIPRPPSDFPAKAPRIRLLSVNEAEYQQNHCRKLVTRKSGRWQLTAAGMQLMELMVYDGL